MEGIVITMGAYYYLAKMKILVSLAYRFEVFTTIGTNFILMLATTYLWKAAYRGIDTVAGANESQYNQAGADNYWGCNDTVFHFYCDLHLILLDKKMPAVSHSGNRAA